jgi:hypothetical protein
MGLSAVAGEIEMGFGGKKKGKEKGSEAKKRGRESFLIPAAR